MSVNIYVGNLPYQHNEESLREVFSPYGEVLSTRVIIDRETKRSRGFGFVEMENEEDANKAIQELHEADVDGRKLKVNIAKPIEEGNRGGGRTFSNNRNGGGGGRGGFSRDDNRRSY